MTALLVLAVLAFETLHPLLLVSYGTLALAFVLSNVRRFYAMSAVQKRAVALLLSVLALMMPIAVFREPAALAHLLVALLSLGAAYTLTLNLRGYATAGRRCLLLAQIFLVTYLLTSDLTALPLENLLEDTSSNGITAALVLLQVNHSTLRFLLARRTSIATSTITLAICIAGYGRGSIIAALMILAINLFALVSWRSAGAVVLGMFLAVVIAASAVRTIGGEAVEFIELHTKIGAGLEDEPRQRMIDDYLEQIDGATAFSGASYRGTSIESDFNGNPHNSYIRAHHLFGLPYLVVMLIFPLLIPWRRHSWPVVAYSASALLVLLMRSFTEPVLFATLLDVFFFGIWFSLAGTRSLPRKALDLGSSIRHRGCATL
ncbi:MAG: hypothetical protein LKCHEGNO_01533 [Burkholderiaceae bacterium]|nr:hypothetical protein [Burkholderiaceae bacterium]